MNWEAKIDAMVEARTDAMIDELYKPKHVECPNCDNYFPEDQGVGSEYFPGKAFCCDECAEEYEANHDPEEEE